MITVLVHYEIFNIGGFDRRRNRSKMFWQSRWVHWVVVRKTYIKEKGEFSRMIDDADVANPNPRPSVIKVKKLVWPRDPQGEPSSFRYEVPFVDLDTAWSKYGLIHFCSWTCPLAIEFYSESVLKFKSSYLRQNGLTGILARSRAWTDMIGFVGRHRA
jgi:hypothetical protein